MTTDIFPLWQSQVHLFLIHDLSSYNWQE